MKNLKDRNIAMVIVVVPMRAYQAVSPRAPLKRAARPPKLFLDCHYTQCLAAASERADDDHLHSSFNSRVNPT